MAKKRGQGDGTISKRMVKGVWDGTWWARITVGRDENGKQKRKAFYGKSFKEVREKLDAAKAELDKGTYIEPSSMTVAQWSDIWMKEYKRNTVKPTTYERLDYCFRVLINPLIGTCKLKDLRVDTIQKLVNNLHGQGLASSTIAAAKATLNSALEQAIANDMLSKNVSKSVKIPKDMKQKEARVLTAEEQKRLIAEAKNDKYGNLFILILATGLRIGEALALNWDDIDFENSTLRVNKTITIVKDLHEPNSKQYQKIGSPKTSQAIE